MKEKVFAIENIQRATEDAMQAVIVYLQSSESPTSEEAHEVIDTILAKHNCHSPEGHIVAGGLQAVEPHDMGSGPLSEGEAIVIDIYPQSKESGHFADMSRTVCIGAPSVELQKMYDTVLEAQLLAISMVGPGISCSAIQEAVDVFFKNAGYVTSGVGTIFKYAEGFVHGVGHGVGTDIHIAPRIGRGSEDVLAEGDVITIEPGLYYKKIGAVRIEDLLLVTKDGSKNLTKFSKQFQI